MWIIWLVYNCIPIFTVFQFYGISQGSICHVFVEYLKCSLIWKIIVTDFSLLVWKVRDIIKENSEHTNTYSDEEIPSNYVILSMWHIFAEDLKCSLIWKIIVTDFSLLIWKVKACLHCRCFLWLYCWRQRHVTVTTYLPWPPWVKQQR